eukprot:1156414-Amphidinium_carterae.1
MWETQLSRDCYVALVFTPDSVHKRDNIDLWPEERKALQEASSNHRGGSSFDGTQLRYLAAVEKTFDNLTPAEMVEHQDRLTEAKLKEWK